MMIMMIMIMIIIMMMVYDNFDVMIIMIKVMM